MSQTSRLTSPSPFTTPVERKQQAMARVLGKTTAREIDWRQLMQEGVLVRLTIGHCGFTARLELSDLGMSVSDERVRRALARTLRLGEKRLLPQTYLDALSRLASGARRCLAKNAFQTEIGAFLPVTAYAAWKTEMAAHEQRFFALRDDILARYADLVEEVLNEYRVIARDTYRRVQTSRPEVLTQDEASFVAAYCERIAALIPTKERIQESFRFDLILRDGVQELQETAAGEREATPMPLGMLRTRADERAFAREQMRRDLVTQLQEQKNRQIEGFLETIVSRLRSLTYDVMGDVLASIQKGGESAFPARSVVQLKNLVTQLTRLNFYGDTEIDQILVQVQEILTQTPAKRKRDLGEIQERLRAIALVSRSTLLDLEQPARSARERGIGIPDLPSTGMVRQARQLLGLDLEAVAAQQPVGMRGERAMAQPTLWTPPTETTLRTSRPA